MNDDIDPGIHRYVNSQGQECNKDGVPIKPIPLPSCPQCGKLNVEGVCETCAGKFFIKREDVAPSWKPSFSQHMEDLYMHSYLQKQHKDLEAKCGKDIADMMYGPIAADKCYISGCTCGKSKYDRQTEDQMKRPMQQEFVDMAFWDKKEPKITTQTVITISSGNGFSTSELREFLDVAEGNHVPTPDLPVEAIFRPAQNDEPATFILRVTKTLNAARGVDE